MKLFSQKSWEMQISGEFSADNFVVFCRHPPSPPPDFVPFCIVNQHFKKKRQKILIKEQGVIQIE